MKVEDKERMCRQYVEVIKDLMGFEEWRIDIDFEKIEDGAIAQNTVSPEYRRARITFDLDQNRELIEMVKSVRHEILHLINCQMDLYRRSMCEVVSKPQWSLLEIIWEHGIEDAVARMEHMMDQFGFTPEKLIIIVEKDRKND